MIQDEDDTRLGSEQEDNSANIPPTSSGISADPNICSSCGAELTSQGICSNCLGKYGI